MHRFQILIRQFIIA